MFPVIFVFCKLEVLSLVKSFVITTLSFNKTSPVALSSRSAFDISVVIMFVLKLIVVLSNSVATTCVETFISLEYQVP